MSNLIKVCGLKDPNQAFLAGKMGVDFIGVVFHPPSKRHVSIQQAQKIAEFAKASGAVVVGVFVEQNAAEMAKILEQTGIEALQLNGDISKREHHLLDRKYLRIWVQPVENENPLYEDANLKFNYLDQQRDFILFDYKDPGIGKTFNWQQFQYTGEYQWGVAGGLNSENINKMQEVLKPKLLDVSSGVENAPGEKDLKLIEQFIKKARGQKFPKGNSTSRDGGLQGGES